MEIERVIMKEWNQQSDEYNTWCSLGLDEKYDLLLEFANNIECCGNCKNYIECENNGNIRA